jgi:hypothetical protein
MKKGSVHRFYFQWDNLKTNIGLDRLPWKAGGSGRMYEEDDLGLGPSEDQNRVQRKFLWLYKKIILVS